ncbi:MAG: hypothetical protein CR988_02970 [Treponema sp.]|nr:MAG: hypothetical protein CR988_02970 [Treponema sp.]
MIRKKEAKTEKKNVSITYYGKEQFDCPVCKTKFKKEELHQGGGRLIAGEITDELHRLYQPSAKYGEVFPLIYQVVVCPKCLYATFPYDFRVPSSEVIEELFETMHSRHESVKNLFHNLDFTVLRSLKEGAASYYLAILCYEHFPKKFSPTIKQAICAIRAAWLFTQLGEKFPEENYNYLSKLFYQKATFLYRKGLLGEEKGTENLSNAKNFGPDTDKNYGYDGVIYMTALLEFKYGFKKSEEHRKMRMTKQKTYLAKMFGLGHSTKEKPGPLLEHARDLYDKISAELEETS